MPGELCDDTPPGLWLEGHCSTCHKTFWYTYKLSYPTTNTKPENYSKVREDFLKKSEKEQEKVFGQKSLEERFVTFTTLCKSIFTDRGKDYGNHRIYDSRFNPIHLAVMVENKCSRILTILWDEENWKMRDDINEEVLRDSLIDLVNYAFFLHMLVCDGGVKS